LGLAACGQAAPGGASTTGSPSAAAAAEQASPKTQAAVSNAANGSEAAAKPAASASSGAAAKLSGGDPAGFAINISSASPAVSNILIYAGLDAGFYQQQHLNVSIVTMAGGVLTLSALSKGEIQFNNNPSDAIEGATRGLPTRVVYSAWQKSPWTVYGKSELKSLADLKGKNVGTTGAGSATSLYFQAALQQAGIPASDVSVRTLPGSVDIYNQLVAGTIDAGVISPPFDTMASQKGLHEVAFIGDALQTPYQGYGSTTTFIAEHRPQVVAMLRAAIDARDWLKSHPDEGAALVVKYTGSPPDVARQSLDKMLPFLSQTGELPVAGVQQALDIHTRTTGTPANVTPDQVVDYGPLHEALGKS
jgi:NitT/TauT family transport system substrate-binding protein